MSIPEILLMSNHDNNADATQPDVSSVVQQSLNHEHLDQSVIRRAVAASAATYPQAAVVQQAIADALLQRLEVLSEPPQRILELGAAYGYLSKQLARLFPQAEIVAVERDQQLQAQGNSWFPVKQIQRVHADASALPQEIGEFDLIISNLLLHWMPQQDMVLAYWRQFLQPGGSIWFTTLGPDSLCELKQAFSGLDNYSHVHDFLDMHHYGDWLLAAGYSDTVMDRNYMRVEYSSLHRLCMDLKQTGAQCAMYNRSYALYPKGYWQQMHNNYLAMCQDKEGLPVTLEVIFGHAVVKQEKYDANNKSPSTTDDGKYYVAVKDIKKTR